MLNDNTLAGTLITADRSLFLRLVDAAEMRPLRRLLCVVLVAHLLVALLSHRGIIRDDAESYVVLGRNLAAGHGFVFTPGGNPTAWRAPVYPAFLAVLFRLTGNSLDAARCAQAFLWVLTAFLTYRLARRTLPANAALFAAGLAGLSPELLGMTGLLWSESLFLPLFLGSLTALLHLNDRAQHDTDFDPLPCVGVGLLFGVAILTRSTALILIPAVWIVSLTRHRSARTVAQAALVTFLALCVVDAWTIRNIRTLGKVIPVESNTGYNLYVGNRPDTPVPFAWKRAETLPGDTLYHCLTEGISETAQNSNLTRVAVAEIKSHPFALLKRGVGKAFDFWLPDFFIATSLRAGAFGAIYRSLWLPVLVGTVGVFFVVMFGAVRGAWRTRSSWETRFFLLILALYTLPHTLVYGASRYHLPLLPLVFVLALHGAGRRWISLRQGANCRARE